MFTLVIINMPDCEFYPDKTSAFIDDLTAYANLMHSGWTSLVITVTPSKS